MTALKLVRENGYSGPAEAYTEGELEEVRGRIAEAFVG